MQRATLLPGLTRSAGREARINPCWQPAQRCYWFWSAA